MPLPHFNRQWHLTTAQKYQLAIYERQERLENFLKANDPAYVEMDPALKVQKPVAGPPIEYWEPIYKTKREDYDEEAEVYL